MQHAIITCDRCGKILNVNRQRVIIERYTDGLCAGERAYCARGMM